MNIIWHIDYEENSFIQACIHQEEWALKMLYEEYFPMLMPISLRYTDNEADAVDIMHDCFIKIFRNIHLYKVGTSFFAWSKRIVINSCIDHYRSKKYKRTEDLESAFHLSADEENVLSKLNSDEILKGLQQLPPSYRSVFNLYVIEGFSHKEIADKLGISESTCRSNLVKARNKLKNYLISKHFF